MQAITGLLYWTMPLALGIFFICLYFELKRIGFNALSWLSKNSFGILLALCLTVNCFVSVPPTARVQGDESNLLATSEFMHLFRADAILSGAIPFEGQLHAQQITLDKRPPLFPFLVSLVHDGVGFRFENVFVVNGILLFILLVLVSAFARERAGPIAALLAPLLLIGNEVLVHTGTSGQFDLLSFILLTIVVGAGARFIRSPCLSSFLFYLAAGVLFTYSRYESCLLFMVTTVFVLYKTRKQLKKLMRWEECMSALLFILLLVPFVLLALRSLSPKHHPESASLFTWNYGLEHSKLFLLSFFSWRWRTFFFGPLNTIGLGFLFLAIRRKKVELEEGMLMLMSFFALLITLFHFGGNCLNLVSIRLFLPISVVGTLMPLFAFQFQMPSWLLKLSHQMRWNIAILILIAIGAFDQTQFRRTRERDQNLLSRSIFIFETQAIDKLLPQFESIKDRALFVSDYPIYFILKGFGSLTPIVFKEEAEKTVSYFPKPKDKKFLEIFFLEISPSGPLWDSGEMTHAMAGFKTELTAKLDTQLLLPSPFPTGPSPVSLRLFHLVR